jgi:hypothetical protein
MSFYLFEMQYCALICLFTFSENSDEDLLGAMKTSNGIPTSPCQSTPSAGDCLRISNNSETVRSAADYIVSGACGG